MSVVTNVILTFSMMEDEEPILAAINAFDGFYNSDDRFIAPTEEVACQCHGGTRAIERHILVAAFNHFSASDFRKHLLTVPWYEPDAVQVMVCEQDQATFSIWSLWDDRRGFRWIKAKCHPFDEDEL